MKLVIGFLLLFGLVLSRCVSYGDYYIKVSESLSPERSRIQFISTKKEQVIFYLTKGWFGVASGKSKYINESTMVIGFQNSTYDGVVLQLDPKSKNHSSLIQKETIFNKTVLMSDYELIYNIFHFS